MHTFAMFVIAPVLLAILAQDPPAADGPAATLTEDVGILRPGPPPLLREGDVITRGVGTMHRDPENGAWLIRVRPEHPGGRARDLVAMPCSLLDEMERMVTSRPDQQIVFEVTGEVYVFDNLNYFLPTHAPHLAGYESPPEGPPQAVAEPPAAGDATGSGSGSGSESDPASGERRAGDRAADLIRSIESRTGPLAMTSGDVDRSAAEASAPMREETIITWRRGRVSRDSLGAWTVIFDADAEGRADPPMVLLPCLLLERLERYATQGSRYAPVLISGRVYTYRGRNYLLPSVYRAPRERTQLTP